LLRHVHSTGPDSYKQQLANKQVQWFKIFPFLDNYLCNTWCCLGDSNLSAAAAKTPRGDERSLRVFCPIALTLSKMRRPFAV